MKPIFVQSPWGYINLSLVTQIDMENCVIIFAGDIKNNLRFPTVEQAKEYFDWLICSFPEYFEQAQFKQAAE